ncbi:MAG: hypothetical protein Q9159_000593 [Coniocarpon cinnabarinum]
MSPATRPQHRTGSPLAQVIEVYSTYADLDQAFAEVVDATCAYYNATTNGTCPAETPKPTTLTGGAAVAATSRTASPTVIPNNYSPSATRQLLMSFRTGSVQVQPGEKLGINVVKEGFHQQVGLRDVPENNQISEPPTAGSVYQGGVEVYGPQLYLVAMVDPDAQTPGNPTKAEYLHWLQPNMRMVNASTLPAYAVGPFPFLLFANETSTPAILDYSSPMPPTYSRPHRYIVYAYQQPLDFEVPAEYAGFGPNQRSNFNIADFAQKAGLGTPFASTYFYAANNTLGAPVNTTGGIVTKTRGYAPYESATPYAPGCGSYGSK